MADPKKPKTGPPPYLPRSWKGEAESTDEPAPTTPGAPARKKKPRPTDSAPEPTGVKPRKKSRAAVDSPGDEAAPKLEETPLLDTYAARQRIRLAAGSVVALVGLIALIVVVRLIRGGSTVDDSATNRPERVAPVDPQESLEREATVLVDSARQADKLGRTPAAINLLQKVIRNYAGTTGARVAGEALDRDRRNRPLFEVEDPRKAGNSPGVPTPTPKAAATAGGPPPNGALPPDPLPGSGNSPSPPGEAVPGVAPSSLPTPPAVAARSLPRGFHADPAAGLHPTGWPLRITCDRDGMVMVLIPGAEFLMGRDDGEPSERPSHRVRLGAYYIDQHEVTRRQYQAYLKESGRPPDATGDADQDLPVTSLTARDARAYCYWANRRLPTEAQWELAARSSDGRVAYGSSSTPADAATRSLRPVMTDPADRSPLGGFDFAGNASEWTGDYYDPAYYASLRDLTIEPVGPTQSRIKPAQATVKGGSRGGSLTAREGVRVEGKSPLLGFRGALPGDALAPPAAVNPAPPANSGTALPATGGVIPF